MKQDSEDVSKLSKILSEKVKECSFDNEEKYQLVSLVDDLILAWCKEEARLYAQILKRSQLPEASTGESQDVYKIQTLVLSKPPIWDVKCITLNKSATGVLLVGNEGIAVVELPKRWGSHSLFEGGGDNLTCRVEYVGEQFFTCRPLVKIISADWHPGSMDHTYITVLSTDNYLRVYNLSYLDIPEQAIAVGKSSTSNREGRKFGVGEGAVAFGIGHPVGGSEEPVSSTLVDESTDLTEKLMLETEKQKLRHKDLLWPVFILYNNGDVYYALTSLNKRNAKRRVLYGPLNMLPSSFDNYGVDFCSLLVLPSSPSVLVIANTKGFVHHCIVMDGMEEPQGLDESQQLETLSMSISQLNLETSCLYLHVYESLHLNLSYATSNLATTSPIALIPDPNTPARYWVYHSEGCHGVALPLVERLLPQDMEFPESDLECQVEHLLCTRSVASASACAVVGLSVSGSSKVFVLLSSGSIQVISLPPSLLPKVPLFHLMGSGMTDPLAMTRKLAPRESFENHIRSLLQRNLSQPLLVSGSWPDTAPEEYLNLVNKVTNTLRDNYIRPQIKAREEVRRRHNILKEQKDHLSRELKVLQQEKKALTGKAHDLAEKYEEANDKHSHLMGRLETVIKELVRRTPTLSSSEMAMLKELEQMTEKGKGLQTQLAQIKSKDQWQTSQIEKEKLNESLRQKQGSALSDNQLTCLKLSLGKESDKLSSLVKKVNQIKKEVGM